MTATITRERDELRKFEELVKRSSRRLLDALGQTPVPADYVERWQHTASRLSDAINRSTPPSLDAEQVAEIRGELLGMMQSVADHDPKRPLDSVETALLGLEAIRHVVRDALDQQAPGEGDARELLHELESALPRVNRKDLAALLGTSDRSIQRTLASESAVAPSRRLVLVARLVSLLRRGWTPEGIVAWFHRPRPELEEHSVAEMIDDAAREQEIFELARHGRAQHGS